jgi:hypothetical protein
MTVSGQYSRCDTPGKKHEFIEEYFNTFDPRSGTMPINFRKLVQTILSAESRTRDTPLGDNKSLHIRPLMAGTVGTLGALTARVIRLACWTLCLIPGLAVTASVGSRYGIEGYPTHFLKQYGREWVDLGVALISMPLCIVTAFHPTAFSPEGFCANITEYYMGRVDSDVAFNTEYSTAKARYEGEVAAASARNRGDSEAVKGLLSQGQAGAAAGQRNEDQV